MNLRKLFFGKGKLKSTEKYKCSDCGQVHEGWPAIAYNSPSYFLDLSQEEKEKCTKSDDICIVKNNEETYYFIRTVLIQKVNNSKENLEYGLWVSLSKKSFEDYNKNYSSGNSNTTYFGWLANNLPDYDYKESIPTTVVVTEGNQRPETFPHKSEIEKHQFIKDYYAGISQHEAQRRVDIVIGKQ